MSQPNDDFLNRGALPSSGEEDDDEGDDDADYQPQEEVPFDDAVEEEMEPAVLSIVSPQKIPPAQRKKRKPKTQLFPDFRDHNFNDFILYDENDEVFAMVISTDNLLLNAYRQWKSSGGFTLTRVTDTHGKILG